MRLIPNDTVISPGGFKETITYDGLRIHPRTPDGIHLTHEGACVERNLVVEALRADGLLTRRHLDGAGDLDLGGDFDLGASAQVNCV